MDPIMPELIDHCIKGSWRNRGEKGDNTKPDLGCTLSKLSKYALECQWRDWLWIKVGMMDINWVPTWRMEDCYLRMSQYGWN